MKHYVVLTIILMTIIMTGCAGNSKNNITVLEGKWISTCIVDSEASHINTLIFSSDSVSVTRQNFIDFACTTADGSTSSASGKFKIGRSVTTSSGVNATEYDIDILEGDGVTEEFTIFSLFSIIDEKLYVGSFTAELDGSTSETRAPDVNFDFHYTKI